jgi:hydroxylaminobenzene mutase
MNERLLRHAFALFLVALIGGLFVPAMPIPRLGLSAHTIGILSAALLLGVGIIWPRLHLSPRQLSVLEWSWIGSSWANWAGCMAGALLGAGNLTTIASAGASASPAAEALVATLLGITAVLSFAAAGLSLWGLRSRHAD